MALSSRKLKDAIEKYGQTETASLAVVLSSICVNEGISYQQWQKEYDPAMREAAFQRALPLLHQALCELIANSK